MSALQRLSLFGFVVFFSGSMVVVGARNMRDRLGDATQKDKEHAERLIHALRGDELFRLEGKYSESHAHPNRQTGSYLPDNDRRKIKEFLRSLIGGGHSDPHQESK